MVLPDDNALNIYLNRISLRNLAATLNSKKFAIGHRFPFLNGKNKRIQKFKVVAF